MGLLSFLGAALASLRREPEFGFCDGLRGLAVLWVCADHAVIAWDIKLRMMGISVSEQIKGLWWPVALPSSGAAGVDVFLVLSGFLIGGSLHREVSKKGRVEVGKFVLRRLFRIYPALFSALLLTMAKYAALGVPQVCPSQEHWWMSTFLVKNIRDDGKCMTHTWSVSLELQLYLVTPLFFMLASFLSKVVPGGRLSMSRCMMMLAALCWAACAARRLWTVFFYGLEIWDFLSLFFYMHTQFRCSTYAAGVLAGVLVADWKTSQGSASAKLACPGGAVATVVERKENDGNASAGGWKATVALCLAFSVVALTWFVGCDANSHENVYGVAWYRRTLPTVVKLHMGLMRPLLGAAVAGIIVLCAGGYAPRTARILGSPLWRPLAGLSYSMYLLQFVGLELVDMPFLRFLGSVFDSETPVWLGVLSCYAGIVLFILGAMAMAVVNYTLVEYPGMEVGRLLVAKLSQCGLFREQTAQPNKEALGYSICKRPLELDLEAAVVGATTADGGDANATKSAGGDEASSTATTRTPSPASGGEGSQEEEGEAVRKAPRLGASTSRGGYLSVQPGDGL